MRKFLLTGVALILCSGVVLLAIPPADAQKVGSGGTVFQVDLPNGAAPQATAIPPNCVNWHEIFPSYCTARHQDSYTDNGDGVISACDFVRLAGVDYHVDWVGPIYFFDQVAPSARYSVSFTPPQVGHNPGNPVCENWHVESADPASGLSPCNMVHIDTWQDLDGSGNLSAGDKITISLVTYILRSVAVDISTTPGKNADIPTLNEWGVLALALLVMGIGLFVLARRTRINTA